MTHEDLKITGIRWRLFIEDPNDPVRAKCSVILNDNLVINEVRVVIGKRGQTFVSYPSREKGGFAQNGYVYPITREAHDAMEKTILDSYYQELTLRSERKNGKGEEHNEHTNLPDGKVPAAG